MPKRLLLPLIAICALLVVRADAQCTATRSFTVSPSPAGSPIQVTSMIDRTYWWSGPPLSVSVAGNTVTVTEVLYTEGPFIGGPSGGCVTSNVQLDPLPPGTYTLNWHVVSSPTDTFAGKYDGSTQFAVSATPPVPAFDRRVLALLVIALAGAGALAIRR